jgi:hypothetical protein
VLVVIVLVGSERMRSWIGTIRRLGRAGR